MFMQGNYTCMGKPSVSNLSDCVGALIRTLLLCIVIYCVYHK